MIEFIPNYIEHSDKRGSFLGLVNFGNWKEINIICSEADTMVAENFLLIRNKFSANSNLLSLGPPQI